MEGYITSYTSGSTSLGTFIISNRNITFDSSILNKWQRVSDVISTMSDTTNVALHAHIRFGHTFATEAIFQAYMDDIILIDLTESFGSGNEPTKEWCDQNINWFEGSKKIYKQN